MASNSSPAKVYHLPGEPAAVIDGVPEATVDSEPPAAEEEPAKVNSSLGSWLQGREVRKLFGEQCFSGTVEESDEADGRYRVVYDDGDSEYLEWRELEEILVPLDIAIPLKSLALRVLNKKQRFPECNSREAPPQSAKKRGRPKGSKNKPKFSSS